MNGDLICLFKGKTVRVEIEGYKINGVLTSFSDSPKGESCVMVLFSNGVPTLVKGNFDSLGKIRDSRQGRFEENDTI